ncbi:hypothetical protein C0991_006630 [Blastosporella zonata]|nr:hypothetical protein C0991_006630 [Blastosporella zonata]
MDSDITHFLSRARPDIPVKKFAGVFNTTTLAARDVDVDTRTGFMPPQPPIYRLPTAWQPWKFILDQAKRLRVRLGDTPGLPDGECLKSESWREQVRNKFGTLLAPSPSHPWMDTSFLCSLPTDFPVIIPPSITLPLLQVSTQLRLPPVLTYSDNALYIWAHRTPPAATNSIPTIDNLCCQTFFTGTTDEEEFYLTSIRIEFKGVDTLELMQMIMDEAFVGDDLATRRITQYLFSLSTIVRQLRAMLLAVKETCDPGVFYHQIRPWFRVMDTDPRKRPWVFKGIENDHSLQQPTELSGPSAGQSSLIHALDIFLGVDQ